MHTFSPTYVKLAIMAPKTARARRLGIALRSLP